MAAKFLTSPPFIFLMFAPMINGSPKNMGALVKYWRPYKQNGQNKAIMWSFSKFQTVPNRAKDAGAPRPLPCILDPDASQKIAQR